VDTRFAFRGDTNVDGLDQHSAQRNFLVGSEVNVSMNPHSTLVFVFAKAALHQKGPNVGGFAVRYDYTWSKGDR
jgi:hypothetical protein